METVDWSLVEYRPGRYVKVSPEGEVLGRVTEAEARAWFANRGWPLGMVEESEGEGSVSEVEPEPESEAESDALLESEPESSPVGSSPPGSGQRAESLATPAAASVQDKTPKIPLPDPQSPVIAPESLLISQVVPEPKGDEPREKDEEAGSEEGIDEGGGSDTGPESPEYSLDASDLWLWLDVRGERGYGTPLFGAGASLERGIALFKAKAWSGGKCPGRLAVHPDELTEALELAALALDLEIIADARVSRGSHRLGLAVQETRV